MKRLVGYVVIFLLLFFPLGGWKLLPREMSANEEEWVYGGRYNVPAFRWVRVMNPGGVRTLNITIRPHENCLIRYRGQVAEITNRSTWWSTWRDLVPVAYTTPGNAEVTGVLCPTGTLFYLPREELASFPERFQQRQLFEAKLIDGVTQVLENKQYGQVIELEEFLTFVEVANPEGVANFGYRVPFLDTCIIEENGRIQEIGATHDKSVYEYTPDPDRGFLGVGIPCPAETLFLQDGRVSLSNLTPDRAPSKWSESG